ncbi:MAG: zinc ribbon domain-containing protein [Candidatus Desulfaltia sp.]|nr:zinc ribbon domain-containing protein [Candidatus Desulfaltia sp.]
MPIYEYHCNDCDKNFELLVFGKEKPICPSCKNKKVVRLMSACGFMSKGSSGETVRASAADSSCGGCSATSCSTCGH